MLFLPSSPRTKDLALRVSYDLRDTYEKRAGLQLLPRIELSKGASALLEYVYTIREMDIDAWARRKSLAVESPIYGYADIRWLETGAVVIEENRMCIFVLVPKPDVSREDEDPTFIPRPIITTSDDDVRYRDTLLDPWRTTDKRQGLSSPPQPDVTYQFIIRSPIAHRMRVESIVECSVGDAIALEAGQEIKIKPGVTPPSSQPMSFMFALHRTRKAPFNALYPDNE